MPSWSNNKSKADSSRTEDRFDVSAALHWDTTLAVGGLIFAFLPNHTF